MRPDRESHLGTAVSEEQEQEPTVAPGEPEAPVGPSQPAPGAEPQSEPDPQDEPSRPHGDDLGEEAEEGAADPAGEHPVVKDLEELTAKAEKADEYLGLAQRTKADFENYRKRAAREASMSQERGVAKLAKELLPAVDNLDRALAAATDGHAEEATLASGIKLVHADVLAALSRVGIEPFSPEGEPFDPQRHEAVAQHPIEGAEPGTVVEVYQRGYSLGDSVLRPARVVVAG